MTTVDLSALLQSADLSDDTTRLVLADACQEAGRTLDEAMLRATHLMIRVRHGELYPVLSCGDVHEDDCQDGERRPSWINCEWIGAEGVGCGGCWIYSTPEEAREENNCTGQSHPSMAGHVKVGDVHAYTGYDIGTLPDLGISDGDREELERRIAEESERECATAARESVSAWCAGQVREWVDAASDEWTGCCWTTSTRVGDLDGMTSGEAEGYAEEIREKCDCADEGDLPSRKAQGPTTWEIDEDGDLIIRGDMDAEQLAEAWDSAAEWLREVELDAEHAYGIADEAASAASNGDWDEAEQLAEQACDLERTYGDCPVYRQLRDLIAELRQQYGV